MPYGMEEQMNELIRLESEYLRRASNLKQNAWGTKREAILSTAKFYEDAAEAINRLIVIGNCRTI